MDRATKILLFGASGQIGSALRHDLSRLGTIVYHDRTSCNICDEARVREVIRSEKPDIIVNAAAYTAVDRAETEFQDCFRANAISPRVMAQEARDLGAYMVHYSTDYVFDGRKTGSYLENDTPCPLNNYGRSKLAGEQALLEVGGQNVVLRVSWIYSATGVNFAKTILRLAADRDELNIIGDQFGAPTSARFVSSITEQVVSHYLANRDCRTKALPVGIFNVAPSGRASWHSYALYLIREARRLGIKLRVQEHKINAITSEEYPSIAQRPKNSLLATTKLRTMLAIEFPDWREDVDLLLQELRNSSQSGI